LYSNLDHDRTTRDQKLGIEENNFRITEGSDFILERDCN
jgi:hypothetical protein